MYNLTKRQKRVIKIKKRNINFNFPRKEQQYICIIAKHNHRLTDEQIKSIKFDLLTPKGLTSGKLLKSFNIHFSMTPNKILTRKGILVRMGGGKAKVYTHVCYLTSGSICILFTPKNSNLTIPLNNNHHLKVVNKFIKKYSFFSYKFPL